MSKDMRTSNSNDWEQSEGVIAGPPARLPPISITCTRHDNEITTNRPLKLQTARKELEDTEETVKEDSSQQFETVETTIEANWTSPTHRIALSFNSNSS